MSHKNISITLIDSTFKYTKHTIDYENKTGYYFDLCVPVSIVLSISIDNIEFLLEDPLLSNGSPLDVKTILGDPPPELFVISKQTLNQIINNDEKVYNRKQAKSLKELETILINIEQVKQYQNAKNEFSSQFFDRETQLKTVLETIENMYINFNSKSRSSHQFLACITGSGMGKTTFGRMLANYLKRLPTSNKSQILKELTNLVIDVFIDYNGGGDVLLPEELTGSCEVSLSKRIFSRGVLGIPLSRSGLATIYKNEEQLFNLKDVLNYLANKFRSTTKERVTIFIHLDEYPMANKTALECGNTQFIKSMLELLGSYRCNLDQDADSIISNIFIIPFLSGTSLEGLENLILSKYTYKYINLSPLTLQSGLQLVTEINGIPPTLQGQEDSIVQSPFFKILIKDLGVVPRYGEFLNNVIRFGNEWTDVDLNVTLFIAKIGTKLLNDIPTLKGLESSYLELLLRYSMCNEDVTWNTKIGDKTVKEISYYGHIFLQESNEINGTFKIFIPVIDQYVIAHSLRLTDFKKVVQFPFIESLGGFKFEEITSIIIKTKINLLSKVPSKTIANIFGNMFTSVFGTELPVIFQKSELYREDNKWINGLGQKIEIDKNPIKTFKYNNSKVESNIEYFKATEYGIISLLGNGCTSFDIRLFFGLEKKYNGKNSIMVVINTKFSTCEIYLDSKVINTIIETSNSLKGSYPDSIIVPAIISNFSISVNNLNTYKDKMIIIHKGNASSFFGPIFHRLSFFSKDQVNDGASFNDPSDELNIHDLKINK